MGKNDKGRAWCFTQFNFDDAILDKLRGVQCERMVVGVEVCPETKREHLQGYCRFKEPVRFSWWKNQFPSAHVELRKGTETEAAEYCEKDGKVVIDRGFNCDKVVTSGMSKNEEAAQIISEIDAGVKWGVLRRRYPIHTYWYRNNVLARIRDEKWFSENGGDDGVQPEY